MKLIKDKEFGGERPLFGSSDIRLENVTIHAGESALKRCRNIEAIDCRFEGKYPFWHTDGFRIDHCLFTPGARAALWYSRGCVMTDTQVDAPKMFRAMTNIILQNVNIPDAQETFWDCANVTLRNVSVENADYLFMHSRGIEIENYRQKGNYSFQYCTDVTIRNAVIHSKDAFWETDRVTVYDSEIHGEYLGWHSRNLRLVRCHISGTQPLCYAENLVMEECTFDADADLAFEESSLKADILGPITSIKNPASGEIHAGTIGEIILDGAIESTCNITADE